MSWPNDPGKDASKAWKQAVEEMKHKNMKTSRNVEKLSLEERDSASAFISEKKTAPPIINKYFKYLESQAAGRQMKIPADIQNILRPHYPGVQIGKVRYTHNIDTVHGQGITVEDNIYFPVKVDFYRPADFYWLLHELEHVGQYRAVGGRDAFVVKYLHQGGLEVLSKGSFNIHDSIGLEAEAISKSDRVYQATHQAVARLRA